MGRLYIAATKHIRRAPFLIIARYEGQSGHEAETACGQLAKVLLRSQEVIQITALAKGILNTRHAHA
eukprot:5895261-Pleurochrysis_carterae.AAC.1